MNSLNARNINIYCDESCHLENDAEKIMLFGSVWCEAEAVKAISKEIRELKESWKTRGEIKWTKVSKSREEFFLKIVDYFFNNENLHFRGLIVDDKSKLNHSYFNKNSHDSFYYKMYYYLLKNVVEMNGSTNFRIYLDIKDTRSQSKINHLQEILQTACRRSQSVIQIDHIRSHESEILQLADLFLGAIGYLNRGYKGNDAKLALIKEILERSGFPLNSSTPPWEEKFNLFFFSPQNLGS